MRESEMQSLLDRAAAGLGPDVDAMVRGGVARGQAFRTRTARRRVGAVAAGVAVAGAATVTIGLLGPGGSAAVDHGVDAAGPGRAEPTLPPGDAPSAPSQQARVVPMDPAKMAWTLGRLLPGAETADETWSGGAHGLVEGRRGYQGGSVVWRGGQVVVLVESSGPEHDTAEERCRRGPGVGRCAPVSGGDWVRSYSYAETTRNVPTGVVGNHAERFTEDGFTVSVTAYNATAEKGEVSGADPVLDLAQVRDLAVDPTWVVTPGPRAGEEDVQPEGG